MKLMKKSWLDLLTVQFKQTSIIYLVLSLSILLRWMIKDILCVSMYLNKNAWDEFHLQLHSKMTGFCCNDRIINYRSGVSSASLATTKIIIVRMYSIFLSFFLWSLSFARRMWKKRKRKKNNHVRAILSITNTERVFRKLGTVFKRA